MARYNLILSDKDYTALFHQAAGKSITLGKYLNLVLHEIANNPEKNPIQKPKQTCVVCGKKGRIEAIAFDGTPIFFCSLHTSFSKYFKGYKIIEPDLRIGPKTETEVKV
jgi:hypothetical protein